MAFRTPAAVLQNENLHIHRGKGVDGLKADLPKLAKTGRQERKALRDLSKIEKPLVSGATKGSALKKKSQIYVPKWSILTDEEIKRCEELAKEGIEYAHFTGNDMQNLHEEQMEKRINKEIKEVMSALHEWSTTPYDFGFRVEEKTAKDFEDDFEDIKMELEPEVLPESPKRFSRFDDEQKQLDDLIEAELKEVRLMSSLFSPFLEHPVNLELKDDLSGDGAADLNNL